MGLFLIKGQVTNRYMKEQLSSLDKLDGNIDSISNRIANVRTWSYVSNKKNWVENSDYWVQLTKSIEEYRPIISEIIDYYIENAKYWIFHRFYNVLILKHLKQPNLMESF